MRHVYLATLGQRPEAITVAFDKLCEQYDFVEAIILHTEPRHSAIAEAYTRLREVFAAEYDGLPVRWVQITRENGDPLLDITDQDGATSYMRGIYREMRACKRAGDTLHLLVAGGRKAMSIYATLAASYLFGPHDRVWTVLSPSEMLAEPGVWHIPPGLRDRVQLVDLPVLPARLQPADREQFDDPLELVAWRRQPREALFSMLSEAECQIVQLLERHPRATNVDLARMLSKDERTIENQLRSVYRKLERVTDVDGPLNRKRA
ncbi:MAG: hypothetical protein IT323_09165, partial [Anaerolineae bacterium]|nr:hypothetical protein [Anaerolineae bacterium]